MPLAMSVSSRTPLWRVVRGTKLFALGVSALALLAHASVAHATPVAFTLTSTASTLDLTAKGTVPDATLTITEQGGSKANRYSGTVNTNLFPASLAFTPGSAAHAANQLGGILGTTPINFRPGVGGVGSAAPGNYGVAITYPLGTPIVIPEIPLGDYGTVSPGSITGVSIDVALRNMDLNFSSSPISHPPLVGAGPTLFDASDVGIGFAAGQADISVGAILNISTLTGGNAILAALIRPVVISVLESTLAQYIPPDSGISLSFYAGTGAQEIVIATGISQDLTTLGSLANSATTQGSLEHIGSNYRLTLPINIDLAAVIPDNPLISTGDLTFNLAGKLVGTAPYVEAVPEPSSVVLAGMGIVGLVAYAARKRRGA